ncbi:uncharacterized protein CDAR_452961 [Caerostris darwini]|uniref:Endonuclease/exonuclease/phosphatase domain-containing protein n=1 Tax=Caerostris darwini TaxID=1538125 RepID=A0AAV4VDB2_9ARAC|nr:uncharacterized protein CDAR_452961 [Caerostris darwini]
MDIKVQNNNFIGGHLNLGNARAAMAFLNNTFAEYQYDFFSMNEPYCYDNKITCIPLKYSIVAHHTQPKAAIAIKSSINCQLVFSNSELTAILASINNVETLLVSIYCSPSKNIENNLNLLRNILLENDNRPTIILGDFNAKSRVWGKRDLDERGSKLLAFCHQLDLNIENQPDTLPSFSSSRGNSWIDLLITKNLNAEVQMDILDEVTNSDHNLLYFSCSFRNSPPANSNKILRNARSWLSLNASIHKILSNNLNFEQLSAIDLNALIENLQKQIKDVATRKNTPNPNSVNNNQRKKKRNAIWWTRDLEIKRSKTRALRRLFQKERDQSARATKKLAYKKNLAEYKKFILHTKKVKFQEFINNITNSNLFGKNYNIICNKKNRSSVSKPLINSAGLITSSIDDSYKAILDFHFPWSNSHTSTMSIMQPSSSTNQDFNQLTCGEVEGLISNIKPNKAEGTDGLPGEIIKEIFFANRNWFVNLLNHLLKNGIFPSCWKIARIVLIDKEQKELNHPSHFRPICVLPCWGKYWIKLSLTDSPSIWSQKIYSVTVNTVFAEINQQYWPSKICSTFTKTHYKKSI